MHCCVFTMSKTACIRAIVVASLLLGTAMPAAANGARLTRQEFAQRAHRAEALAERVKRLREYSKKLNALRFGHHGPQPRRHAATMGVVPELDANAAASALALLVGGLFVLCDSRSPRSRTKALRAWTA